MCLECFNLHTALPMFASHKHGDNLVKSSAYSNNCSLHNDLPFHYFCTDCYTTLCEICKPSHNKEHSIRFLQEFYNDKKDEFKINFILPPYPIEEIFKSLDESDKEIIEEINKEVIKLKDKINSIIGHLIKTSNQLDQEQESLHEEIAMNNYINKILYNNLISDLETMIKSPEFDFNCLYLSKIDINNSLTTRELKYDIITETIKDMDNLIDVYNQKINDGEMLQIIERNNKISVASTLTGHTNKVHSLIRLQDGGLASASADNTIKIWDPLDKFKCIHTITGHTDSVLSLVQLKNGTLASGSADNTIKIWDPLDKFNCIHTITGHTDSVLNLIQLRDGRLVSSSYDKSIIIWKEERWWNKMKYKMTNNIVGHTEYVSILLELQDGQIASGSGDRTIRIWNSLDNFRDTYTLTGHSNSVFSLIQLKDGKLASGSGDTSIRIWDPQMNFNCTHVLLIHSNYVWDLMELRDGRLASASVDNTIKISNPQKNFKCIQTMKGHTDSVGALVLLQDGRIASGSNDMTIKIWNSI